MKYVLVPTEPTPEMVDAIYEHSLAQLKWGAALAAAPPVPDVAAILEDAIECVESWGSYASGYFQIKHDYQGDLARLRAVLAQLKGEK